MSGPGLCTQTQREPFLCLGGVSSVQSAHGSVCLVAILQGKSLAFYLQRRQMPLPYLDYLRCLGRKLGFLFVRHEAVSLARNMFSGGSSGPFVLRIYPLLPIGVLFCLCLIRP